MSTYADRLKALREQLKASSLDGFVVPLTDEHMSEYVGSYAQRLAWLTGFQGSAGSAVVLPQEAAIFVDGRYTLQVRSQVDGKDWSYQSVPETSVADWLEKQGADAAVLSALDSIAWAFNVRGQDVSRAPVALAFALVRSDGTADLFVNPEKISPEVQQHLGNGVRLHDRNAFEAALGELKGQTVAVDPERAVAAIFEALDKAGAKIIPVRDPTV